ncbi:MAG: patatin-like phospholipase family protein, partial [Candidatus Eremiobacterota bacterium]
LREVGSDRRREFFVPLARAWAELNARAPEEVVSPPDAPTLIALEGPPPKHAMRPYDRALALGEAIEHTLNGLGIAERREFLGILRRELAERQPALELREGRLRAALGEHYRGLDVQAALGCRERCPAEQLEGLQQLQAVFDGERGPLLDARRLAELGRHRAVMDWALTNHQRYGDVDFGMLAGAACFKQAPIALGEFYDPSNPPDVVTMLGPGPSRVETLGQADGARAVKASIVLEGGGGKGFAYVECLKMLRDKLAEGGVKLELDEFAGTSAGAITAAVLATGFSLEEVGQILDQLDFKKFNSDAMWLMGGADPKVRGLNRTGLFSMQKMYRELHRLMSEKLAVEGRPVLFRDLPFKLKICAVVLNTDLPPDDPLRKHIDPDGRFVMSNETTPNFDVVAAVLASASVPGFFNAPQMEVAREVGHETKRYRIQFCDGGVVDNLPVSSTTPAGKRALVMLPVNYETIDPATGEKKGLSTLNFDAGHLDAVNAHNRGVYGDMVPRLGRFLASAGEQGLERTVLAF